MSAVFACSTGPGESRGVEPPPPSFAATPVPTLPLSLTLGEARGLLALAEAGRAALDVDPTLLRHPAQRDAARRAVSRLRRLARP